MKKNLRIVSAAAAALLAVAPVAAAGVVAPASTVSAAAVNSANAIGTIPEVSNGDTVNVKPNVTLNTSVTNNGVTSVNAAVSASFEVTVDGTTATSTLKPGVSSLQLKDSQGTEITNANFNQKVNEAAAGDSFSVTLTGVGLNFGDKNANKDITLKFPAGASATATVDGKSVSTDKNGELKVTLDKNGVVNLDSVSFTTTAKNFADPAVITWFSANTGAPVTSATFQMYAGSDAGKMNLSQVLNAIPVGTNKANGYFAQQLDNKGDKVTYTNNLKEALKAAGVEVDAQGWFVAPKSFTFNYTATSSKNNASATLPVTVTVPNGKDVTPATVPSQSKTIMHNAYFYDKDAKRVGTDKLTRYNSVTVAMSTTKIGDKTYYEVVENGKATGKFINADNIDGTKRTLKHNAYVYKSSKKRANKVVLKKGDTVVTYGGTYTFKNGKQYYKIGNDTKKTYVKASNF